MHRKMAVFDGHTAFVGGINIIDDATGNPSPTRLDFALQLKGPLLQAIARAMDRQWRTLSRLSFFRRTIRPAPTHVDASPSGDIEAAFLLRDNLAYRGNIEAAYAQAIAQARKEITLAMAYFIPSRTILNALLAAAQRGVQVRLLLQGRIEYRLQHYAAQSLYTRLLAAGVAIYEYQPGFMHAKVGIIDEQWAMVGSANLDPFSLLVAREANILVLDHAFCTSLRLRLAHEIAEHSHQITGESWKKRSGLHRLLRILSARLLFRLLSLTRYANNY
jgi:cardiolipin synthase